MHIETLKQLKPLDLVAVEVMRLIAPPLIIPTPAAANQRPMTNNYVQKETRWMTFVKCTSDYVEVIDADGSTKFLFQHKDIVGYRQL